VTRFVAFGIDRCGLRVSAAAMTTWPISIRRLVKGTATHSLNTDERETGVDECTDETEEMSGRSSDAGKISPRTRVAPVSEPDPVVIGSTTESDDQTDENETKKAKDLDAGSDDFGFAKSCYQRVPVVGTYILTFSILMTKMSTRPMVMTTAGVMSLQ
jgi:hypothetical protein